MFELPSRVLVQDLNLIINRTAMTSTGRLMNKSQYPFPVTYPDRSTMIFIRQANKRKTPLADF